MKYTLPLILFIACSPKGLQITEDILTGEAAVIHQVIQDEVGTLNFQVKTP